MENEKTPESVSILPNYAEDLNKANDSNWLKFKEGETIVTVLNEMTPVYTKQFPSGSDNVRDLEVETNGEKKTWSLKVGGKKSVYYKVLEIAARRGSLKGAKLRVMRQGKDKDNTTYIIMDVPDGDNGYQNVNRAENKPENAGTPNQPTA